MKEPATENTEIDKEAERTMKERFAFLCALCGEEFKFVSDCLNYVLKRGKSW
ncbi:MAG TPA: hypothetical protein VMH06_00445 [Thermodesulfovibrionales bacterium]|nr:hypothetical protein [Thermodesulfovibrionales bacterium]